MGACRRLGWQSRNYPVLALHSLAQKMDYAARNHIQYVVDDCQSFDATAAATVFRAHALCVGAVAGR